MRSFIVYNALHGVVGLGATTGLLGLRFKIAALGPLLHFSTPGTLCSPLFPELARRYKPVPAVRGAPDVVAYWLLVASLAWAVRAPELTMRELAPVYVLMALHLVTDFSILQAMRLEIYGYMVLCLGFPDWQHGCQVVQLALWCWAGVSKMGPWWKYVLPFISKDGLYTVAMPPGFLARLFWKDEGRYHEMTDFAVHLSYFGCLSEILFPALACAPVGSVANAVGVGVMVVYHVLIAAAFAFASVQEWNYFSIVCNLYFFGTIGFALPSSPCLLAFLAVVSVLVPLVGQVYPTVVPFLTAYRPYMGNWRFCWFICKRSALGKHNKLVTYADPFWKHQLGWFYSLLGKWGAQGEHMAPAGDHMLLSYLLHVPNFRAVVPMFERFLEDRGWTDDDVVWTHSEGWQNQVFGWSLGTGYLSARECVREAMLDRCGFEEGEMFMLQVEPMSLLPFLGSEAPFAYKVRSRLFDVTKGPADAELHCSFPFAELAAHGPTEMPFSTAFKRGGASFKGNLSEWGLDVYH
ncbi:unnamed protein product [Polarella glacialis]|uniref:Uncharacterized protein n=1 Tax=Polarella glacialis TaxID=89957 RepID=A0A813HHF7_POLGL|nr:unnamed protein product [Polarella glacialis]